MKFLRVNMGWKLEAYTGTLGLASSQQDCQELRNRVIKNNFFTRKASLRYSYPSCVTDAAWSG